MFKWKNNNYNYKSYSLDVSKIYIAEVVYYGESWISSLAVAARGTETHYSFSAEDGMEWAEERIMSCLEQMRDVFENPGELSKMFNWGKIGIGDSYSIKVAGLYFGDVWKSYADGWTGKLFCGGESERNGFKTREEAMSFVEERIITHLENMRDVFEILGELSMFNWVKERDVFYLEVAEIYYAEIWYSESAEEKWAVRMKTGRTTSFEYGVHKFLTSDRAMSFIESKILANLEQMRDVFENPGRNIVV